MIGSSGNLLSVLFSLGALVMAIAIHEFSHALTADRLGDPTPRLQGRLTLNPLAHLDPLGTIMLLLVRFGWGKPVQIDPFNLRHPRRDNALISLAGPFSNFFVAAVAAFLIRLLFSFRFTLLANPVVGVVITVFVAFLEPFVILNIMLGVFNLLPIHPLDGFSIVEGFLPEEYASQWHELMPYGYMFLLFFLFPLFGGTSVVSRVISPVINFVLSVLLPGGRYI